MPKPMPTTKRAVVSGIHRVLHDYHRGMDAAGIFYSDQRREGWVSVNCHSGLTPDDYRRALERLPWTVAITERGDTLVVSEVADASGGAA